MVDRNRVAKEQAQAQFAQAQLRKRFMDSSRRESLLLIPGPPHSGCRLLVAADQEGAEGLLASPRLLDRSRPGAVAGAGFQNRLQAPLSTP